MIIKVPKDLPRKIVPKVGSFTVEYGVKGRELELLIARMTEKFIRDMELRGYRLIPYPGNPTVVCNEDGSPMATYALDWDMAARQPNTPEQMDRESGPKALEIPRSLEDSRGLVDYRIVGIFSAPEREIEILTTTDAIREQERRARNPVIFQVVKFKERSGDAEKQA